jgi:hypothetical protein
LIELMVTGLIALVIVAFLGLFAAGISVVLWVVFLPFRLVGWLFKGLGFLLALPFMLLFGALGVLIFGFGALVFLIPFAPFVLLAFMLWRWMRGRPRATVSA